MLSLIGRTFRRPWVMTATTFASEVGSAALFAGAILVLQGVLALVQGGIALLQVVAIIVGVGVLLSGKALRACKTWGRTAVEFTAWVALVLGITATGFYLWVEIPLDPTESPEMAEAGRFGVLLAIFFLVGWIGVLSWVIHGLRRADLRRILHT
jgi:peptidoglycan biosynthesis protein MviN/MurJ (putative lipid II flippase)